MQYRTIRIFSLSLLVAGCATQTDPKLVSDWGICEYTMAGGGNAAIAQQEANRRGLDCRQLYPAILAKRQQQAQALQNAADYFNRPAPVPHTTQCSSYRVGNTVQTDCR